VGRVELDISQDAEKAVTAVQDFLTAYNEVLSWINTRLTEKELDASTKATVDSDDFRMKWGVLNGNSLLRTSKERLRRLTSQIYITPVLQRVSRDPVYGTMDLKGIVGDSFSITVAGRAMNVLIQSGDTIQTIKDRINDPNYPTPGGNPFLDYSVVPPAASLAKAEVSGNKLTIRGLQGEALTLGGSTAALSVLGLNFEYTALSQVGIKLPAQSAVTDQAKLGELEFDTSVFMTALENNTDDVALLMTSFASSMDAYMKDMLTAAEKEVAPGITTPQGAVIREIKAIDTEIQSIDKYLTEYDRRLEMKRQSLFNQYSAAETVLAELMEQASWLSSVVAQLQGS
jgi:flagellar hook-associated protein 2